MLGEVEEYFIEQLRPGDTFVLRRRGAALRGHAARTRPSSPAPRRRDPKIPTYDGGKFPLSTHLADARARHAGRPARMGQAARPRWPSGWSCSSSARSSPRRDELLVETFPRGGRHYPGRLSVRGPPRAPDARHAADAPAGARRRRARSASSPTTTRWPSGASATLGAASQPGGSTSATLRRGHAGRRSRGLAGRIEPDEAHLPHAPSSPGLIERRHPGQEKTGRQVTISTDLIYDVLRRHDPDHILLRGRLGRCGHRPARHRAARRLAAPHQGPNQASSRWTTSRRLRCRSCWRSAGSGLWRQRARGHPARGRAEA